MNSHSRLKLLRFVCAMLLLMMCRRHANSAEWIWQVAVVPPPAGWESSAGQAIRSTLLWYQSEIADRPDGLKGHDLRFVFLSPDSGSNLFTAAQDHVAVLSFADAETDSRLTEAAAGGSLPLLLAGGEEVFLYRGEQIIANVFALDLFRDYRVAAYAAYAARKLTPLTDVCVVASRFSVNLEREAKIFFALLPKYGLRPSDYWIDASIRDSYKMLAQELQTQSDHVIVSCAGAMASRELWRELMKNGSQRSVWYAGAPDKSFSACRGMLCADQNMFLATNGGFEDLKRTLWNTRTVRVPDLVAAGRASTLASWLLKSIEAIPFDGNRGLPAKQLPASLAHCKGIAFGRQQLSIDPTTHRPRKRTVYFAEASGQDFRLLNQQDVSGLGYYNY